MSDTSMMNQLFSYYKSSEYCNIRGFVHKVREENLPLTIREAELIWEAFGRAAEEWEPRMGGM